MTAVITIIPCGLAAYYGASYISGFIDAMSGSVLTIFTVIGGMMPALGIAITFQYIFKGEARVFLFLGFILATYSGLGLLPLGIIAALVAIIYTQITDRQVAGAVLAKEEGDYDFE